MATVYLALYKGRGKRWPTRLRHSLVRWLTQGRYSHCEIAVKKERVQGHYDHQVWFECYTASFQDDGVRCKIIDVTDRLKWDLIALQGVTESQIHAYFERTQGKKYDIFGALGLIFGTKQHPERYFCSEWCFNAIRNSDQGWRFSPNQLAVIFGGK